MLSQVAKSQIIPGKMRCPSAWRIIPWQVAREPKSKWVQCVGLSMVIPDGSVLKYRGTGYPQFSSMSRSDFPWNKPSMAFFWGTPMTMEIPVNNYSWGCLKVSGMIFWVATSIYHGNIMDNDGDIARQSLSGMFKGSFFLGCEVNAFHPHCR